MENEDSSGEANTAQHCFTIRTKMRMAVHDDDSVCLSDDGGLKRIDNLLNSKYTAKDMGTLVFEDSDVKSLLRWS